MSLNASGIRDTARVLRISTDTVLSELKKKETLLTSVNMALLRTLNPAQIVVDIEQAGEAEIDEMWSFVAYKGNPRRQWQACVAGKRPHPSDFHCARLLTVHDNVCRV